MAKLPLAKGGFTLVDDEDLPQLADRRWYRTKAGYAAEAVSRGGRYLHAVLMATPKGMHTDHINGDRLDNRRANLRVVSPQRNQVNRVRGANRNSKSGIRGVYRVLGNSPARQWCAYIYVDHKKYPLGTFATIEEATLARKQAERRYYGELCPGGTDMTTGARG